MNTTIAERIKEVRKANGLTQQEFADRLGLKRSTVASYETERNEPLDPIIKVICEKFHINEAWLRTGAGEMRADMTLQQELTLMFADVLTTCPDKRSAIVAALLSQTPEHWELIADLAEDIVARYKAQQKEG